MLQEIGLKIKQWARRDDIFLSAIIVMVGFGSFAIGRLSALHELSEPLVITHENAPATVARSIDSGRQQVEAARQPTEGGVVASKTGSKYHFPWCAGSQRIKEANKLWFATVEEARTAGYTPAENCKGLKR